MKKFRVIILSIITAFALNSCSNNSSMINDINSASDNVIRFVNGTFSAQIDNSDVKSVYDAAALAINNNENYSVDSSAIKDNIAKISGKIKSSHEKFNVKMVKYNSDIVSIYIKIGAFGDKQSSIDLLSDIRTNLGL